MSGVTITCMSRTAALLLAIALSSITIAAQSFDCKVAHTPREQTICADTRLQALDAELAANYKALRTQLSSESAALVQSDQREWLHWIDLVCPAHGKGIAENQTRCLQNEYFTRVHDLQHTAHLGTALIFPRAHFVYKPGGKDDENPADNSPGFGYGSLRWPQIDHPDAAQSTFNAAVKAKAAKLAIGFFAEKSSTDKNATFDTGVDPSGTVDAYFSVEAAGDRFVSITLTDGKYGWGAAHPLTDETSFLWWLDRGRELTAADVFVPNSGWQDKLTTLAVKNLRSQSDLKDMLGDDIDKTVHETASDPASWTITRDGLTITFGQYEIGPYAIGMPEVHIPWADLKPCLQPTLDPATLPAPLPKKEP